MVVSGLTSEMSLVACNMHIVLKAVATNVVRGATKHGACQFELLVTYNPLEHHKMDKPCAWRCKRRLGHQYLN